MRVTACQGVQALLTNPDMLHLGIFPNHRLWSSLFRGLRYVVIDEAHVYSGVFGSHMAEIIRRLRRIASRYGASPQFILCSATIANPEELASVLVALPFRAIILDAAPRGAANVLQAIQACLSRLIRIRCLISAMLYPILLSHERCHLC